MSDHSFESERLATIGEVDPTGGRNVQRLLDDQVLASAWYASETDSTNSVALRQARESVLRSTDLPRLILADRQTAGRGRHGRAWHSDDSSLTFTILIDWIFRDDIRSRLLSMAVGIGVAEMLEFEFAPKIFSLKWPNDLYFGGRKIGGILLEASASLNCVAIGVGLNVASAPDLSNVANASSPTSIADVVGRKVLRYQLIEPVTKSILSTIEMLKANESDVLAAYRPRCILTGQAVTFEDCGRSIAGECLGIDDLGALLIQTGNEVRHLSTGEARLLRLQKN